MEPWAAPRALHGDRRRGRVDRGRPGPRGGDPGAPGRLPRALRPRRDAGPRAGRLAAFLIPGARPEQRASKGLIGAVPVQGSYPGHPYGALSRTVPPADLEGAARIDPLDAAVRERWSR